MLSLKKYKQSIWAKGPHMLFVHSHAIADAV